MIFCLLKYLTLENKKKSGRRVFSKDSQARESVHNSPILNLEIMYSNVKFFVHSESEIENMSFA